MTTHKMKSGWCLLPNKKVIVKKTIPIVSAFLCWLGFGKTRMIDLYKMVRDEFHEPEKIQDMMVYSFPLDHDNFPKPKEYPYYFRLMDGWKIEKSSIKYLKEGPLFSENSASVLVHSKVFVKPTLYLFWKFIVALSVLITLVVGITQIVLWVL